MRITLLGTGTPVLDPARQHSSLVVHIGDQKILVDAGRGVTSQMARAGIHPQDIDAVFITHHHYDHIGNLGEFLLTAWHGGRTAPLPIYGPPSTREIVNSLLNQVYARDIAFALFTNPDTIDIKAIVNIHDVSEGVVCENPAWRVHAAYVDHGNTLGLSRDAFPCLGYRIESENKIIAISGDTIDCAGLDLLAHQADCLIQCCYLADAELTTPAFERSARFIIASAGQVGVIAARNHVKKLVLTHIRPKSAGLMQSLIADIRRSYDGTLIVGEDLMEIQV